MKICWSSCAALSPPRRQVNVACSVTDGPASVLDSPRTVPRLVLGEHHSLDSAPPTDPCPRCPDTDSLAVRQRRWSASSQSDVVSLTENAVPSFDGRLAPNAQNSSGPSLPNPLTDDPPPSQLPADAVSLRNQQLSALIGTLQAECDQVLASNNELTLELVLLQQRRIALEILLERLTPLEA
nr:unnamed protein product [Spirometra erinaceieuropaei]